MFYVIEPGPADMSVTPEQDQLLREYARRFGHIERTLFAELQQGKAANQLKSEYLRRFDITARQFNGLRIQLQGKIASLKERIPVHIENLKTKIRKAKKTIAELLKSIPGTNQLHRKRRRLGAIGIDINAHQLVLGEVDRCGNFVGGEPIPCVSHARAGIKPRP
jgi:hypothetical protein